MAKNNNRELLGTEKISKLIPQMALPTIVAQLISTFYNLVDTYFVSQLGTSATAAVGVNNSIERIISMISMLIGSGAASYIARLLGEKRDLDASRVMSTTLITGFGSGLIILILGKIFLSPLVDFLGATPDCRQYSIEYGTYVLLAAPFLISSFIMNMILRSEGSSTFAMIGMSFGGILNCFLDPIFIFKMNLGVAGASMATAISKVVSFAILLMPYLRKQTAVTFSLRRFGIRKRDAVQVITIGMSSFLRSLLSIVALIILNRMAGEFSTAALASVSVASRIMMFPFAAVLGIGMGLQPVIGYNWGSRRYDRVKEAYIFALKVAVVGGIALGGLICLLAHPLIGIFNTAQDPEIYRLGCLSLRAESACLVLHVTSMITNTFYTGTGRPVPATIMSTARNGYLFIPLLFILPGIFGVEGLCLSQASADIISLLITVPFAIRAFRIINGCIADSTKAEAAGE